MVSKLIICGHFNFVQLLNLVSGSARREVDLEVHDQPRIFSTAERLIVFQGQSIALPCEVTGTPFPTVTWRKGATIINSDVQGKIIRGDNSLRIISAQVQCLIVLLFLSVIFYSNCLMNKLIRKFKF